MSSRKVEGGAEARERAGEAGEEQEVPGKDGVKAPPARSCPHLASTAVSVPLGQTPGKR